MPKYEKGLLGVRKDPRNQMLFSFTGGEKYPSDDSEDSDYNPSDFEEDEPDIQQNNKKPRKSRKKAFISSSEDSSESEEPHNISRPNKKSTKIKKSKTDKRETLQRKSKSSLNLKTKRKVSTPKTDGLVGGVTSSSGGWKVDSDLNASPGIKRPKKSHHQIFTENCPEGIWSTHVPPELLLRIFKYVVDYEGALPFLCRAGRVCSLWYDTSRSPILWQRVDLSYGWVKSKEETLLWLCHNRLSRLKHINLSSWKQLKTPAVEVLAQSCPLLESINLSYCSKVSAPAIEALMTHCPHLASVDLSFINTEALLSKHLIALIKKQGPTLQMLNFSGNTMRGFNSVLNAIATHCVNLKHLDICNATFSSDFLTFDIEKLQEGCALLRVLRLTNSKFRAPAVSERVQADSRGFPELEELSVAISPEGINTGIAMDDTFLHRLLKASCKLRLLDIRGSTHITTQGLQCLPITDLQHLFISQSSIAKYDGIEAIMHKWQHSLVELDLSWNVYPGMSLDLAMRKLSDDPSKSKLYSLNLSGTCISCGRLKSLLEGCPNLEILNLASCRGLPRGMKREFLKKCLEDLRRDIDKIIEEEAQGQG